MFRSICRYQAHNSIIIRLHCGVMEISPDPHVREETLLSAGGRLTINLDNLCSNFRQLADLAAPALTAAVVKADAYGLGAARVSSALARAGCRRFFVAHLHEALPLRASLPADAVVYVLNGLQPQSEVSCATIGVVPVLNGMEQAVRWARTAAQLGCRLPAALQLDSGMSRLGMPADDVATLATDPEFSRHVRVDLVMSHLACADEPDSPSNLAQLQRFSTLAAWFPDAPRSLANSSGILLGEAFRQDIVRPGAALFGLAPRRGPSNPMKPVVRLDARVIQIRPINAGEGVGYGLTYARDTPGELATIAVGYADGWPRCLSSQGAAYFQGTRLPFAGRVSMDSITLDISELRARGVRLQLGDEVELLGPHQTLEQVAEAAGTIGYEILTSLGRRYERTYQEKRTVSPAAERSDQ
jgi:alanine racemase